MNGLLVSLWPEAPSRSPRDPPESATRFGRPRDPVPFETRSTRGDGELLPFQPTPEAQCAPPVPRLRCPALLSEHGASSGVDGFVPETAHSPVKPPRQGDRSERAPSDPDGSALTRPSRSPPTRPTPTPSSSSDDFRGWVVPGISSADPGLAARCLPPSTREEPEPFLTSRPANRTGDASFTSGSTRP